MATLRVLHFGEELFATVGATKYGYDALNMRNVFRKIPRREGDVAEKGQHLETSCRTSPSLHCSSTNSICKETGVSSTGKSKGAVNSLTSAASGLTPTKREANCASHNRSFTSKVALPCCLTLRPFRYVVMSVSRDRRASHRGSKN